MASLPTKLLIDAARANAQANAVVMTFLHRGDPDSGQLLISFYDSAASLSRLARRERDWETDDFHWVPVKGDKALDGQETSDYIARATDIDPDLWVIELECSPAENPFL